MSRPGSGTVADDGSALVEFVGLSVILLLPIVYLLLTVFDLQRGAFAAGQAAREAGRAFATAPSTDAGLHRAQVAADLAYAGQGLPGPATVTFAVTGASCRNSPAAVRPRLTAGSSYVVCIRLPVALPYADKGFFAHLVSGKVIVIGQYVLVVDSYRGDR